MSQSRLNEADSMHIPSKVGSVSIAPYEYAAVYEYLGKNRYLQASFCKSAAKLYSDKFGMYTTVALSNIAAEEGLIGVLEWSKEIGCRWDKTLYMSCAKAGNVHVLRWLVINGCPIPCLDLVWAAAAAEGHLEFLKFAYDSKFRQNFGSLSEVAVEKGRLHILRWIYEVGGRHYLSGNICSRAAMGEFSVSSRVPKNSSMLGLAAFMGYVEVMEFLINDCHASVNSIADNFYPPLFNAVLGGHVETVKLLLDSGADVAAERNGSTALTIANGRGYAEIAQVLRDAGA